MQVGYSGSVGGSSRDWKSAGISAFGSYPLDRFGTFRAHRPSKALRSRPGCLPPASRAGTVMSDVAILGAKFLLAADKSPGSPGSAQGGRLRVFQQDRHLAVYDRKALAVNESVPVGWEGEMVRRIVRSV